MSDEVILNGDSPAPTRFIEGVVQLVAPTTTEQRSLPTEWRTHTLIWRNKTDLEEQSLDDLFNSLKIYEVEVKSSSTTSTSTQNIAFVSSNIDSTNESVSAAASVYAISAKIPISALPNVDNLSNAAEEEPTNYALMAFSSSSSSSSDNKVVSCSKSCTKAYATLQSHYDKLSNELRKSQFDVLSYQTGLESVEARLLVYQQNETVFEKNIKLLKLDIELKDKALVVLRQKFESAEKERDDLKLKLKNDDLFTSESDDSLPASPQYDRYNSRDVYHAVPPPYTGTFMPPKPDLVFNNAPNINETVHTAFNVVLNPAKPHTYLSHTHRPSAPIVEDWISNLEDDSEPEIPQNSPSLV
uniref:Uncharacterized protein n=1 Tax=Tanacetum cinerariifolium TaxID=118510 RepID=A0A699GV64_TANCI|nr:hypothetical protein [Tanacetum cinerariifolium]